MEVFKFGGASVKSVEGLKNVVHVLKKVNRPKLVIVVSAMGKTTNALEEVVRAYFEPALDPIQQLEVVRKYHFDIVEKLDLSNKKQLLERLEQLFHALDLFLKTNISRVFDYVYDQVVSFGELLSSSILHAVLNENHFQTEWVDIREVLHTDANFREAQVDLQKTEKAMRMRFKETSDTCIYLTQGFIGRCGYKSSTTLGREGSDYTAAIIGYCLDAERVTIWKDVPGVLSADPRYFKDSDLLHTIGYNEAVELAFYGASVIHPKTLQPLQRKNIPLFVKPFADPKAAGTCITAAVGIVPLVPCFILKKEETLLKLFTKDFSFMLEKHWEEVFQLMGKFKIKVDLIQNSALSFSMCVQDKFDMLKKLIQALKNSFKIEVVKDVDLYTIRYFTPAAVAQIEQDKQVLLKQVAGNMAQLVVK